MPGPRSATTICTTSPCASSRTEDRAGRLPVLGRVVEEVRHDLAYAFWIGCDLRESHGGVELHIGSVGQGHPCGGDRALDGLAHVARTHVDGRDA